MVPGSYLLVHLPIPLILGRREDMKECVPDLLVYNFINTFSISSAGYYAYQFFLNDEALLPIGLLM